MLINMSIAHGDIPPKQKYPDYSGEYSSDNNKIIVQKLHFSFIAPIIQTCQRSFLFLKETWLLITNSFSRY